MSPAVQLEKLTGKAVRLAPKIYEDLPIIESVSYLVKKQEPVHFPATLFKVILSK